MKLLALDASTEALSVAVVHTARDYDIEHFEIAPQAHARRLLPLAQELLERAELELADLDGFAFARGPGAFTGLRIAAGLIQGLAAGVDRPVVPVSTLAALAARCLHNDEQVDRIRVVQDARMGEIYTADYMRGDCDSPQSLGAERVIRPDMLEADEANAYTRAGNGWGVVAAARGLAPEALAPAEHWPHALDIARLAIPVLRNGEGLPASQALPVYVRDDVARKPGGSR